MVSGVNITATVGIMPPPVLLILFPLLYSSVTSTATTIRALLISVSTSHPSPFPD